MNTPLFSAWLDDFFTSYYQNRPVNATFIGVHEHDHRLPDYSENGVGDALAEMQNLLERLYKLPSEPLTPIERIDQLLAEGFLKTQIWEYHSNHFQRGNPSVYTGEAVFGVLSLFLTAFVPLPVRVESAIQRLEAIPAFLAQAAENVRHAPRQWTERAMRECDGALAFLNDGVDLLIAEYHVKEAGLRAAANKAASAFLTYRHQLKAVLLQNPSDDYACGEDALDLYLRQGHFLEYDADEIVQYAETQILETERYLDEHIAEFGITDGSEASARLSDLHPTVNEYYDRYTQYWNQTCEIAQQNNLLTWKDFPIQYKPRPAWARKAAPYLYFLYYRSPAAYNRPEIHDYLVTPIDENMPVEEQQRLLRATNDSVIKLNHVIHHGSIGHHIQNWHAFRSPSRIGQMAAVDCASRISMFSGGTMAEGWACYATSLMSEVGFLTPLEEYSEHRSRIRMCARAIVDIRLHQNRFTLDDAIAYYEKQAGMGHDAATGEAVKNSMFPGGAVMYLMGHDYIHQLRAEIAELEGNRFNLCQFHDRFLSYGSIPVTLIGADMKRRVNDAE